MKRDAQFEKELCSMFDSVQQVQAIQLEQLRENIEILHAANKSEIDVNAIALQVMDLPINHEQSREISFKCEGCTDCKGDHKVLSKDPQVKEDETGDLADLSYIQNANEMDYNKDFYHHCPEIKGSLVRLIPSMSKGSRKCPICLQKFKPK